MSDAQKATGESNAPSTTPSEGDVCFINNLPLELLSHIFEVGTEDDDTESEDEFHSYVDTNIVGEKDSKDPDTETKGEDWAGEEDDKNGTSSSDLSPPFPIIVSHVCRHWRDIAFSTPSLWTTIVFVPQARPPYEPESTLLERSKSLPIDIYVRCDLDDDDDDDLPPSLDDLRSLFALLIPHVHRWRTMEVTVSDYLLMCVFLQAVSDSSVPAASQLQTLELYDHEETGDQATSQYPNSLKLTLFSGSAPLLTKLVLWGVHVDWGQPWIASALNLKDLELAYHTQDVRPSWIQFVTILRGAPGLEKLELRQSGPSGDPSGWFIEPTAGDPSDLNTPIRLLQVKHLVFMFQPPAYAIGLFRKLYLPALKNLHLDFDSDEDYTDFVQELARPIIALAPTQEQPRSLLSSLTGLKLSALPCRTECVERLYSELQNLASLEISLDFLHPYFLSILFTPCSLPGGDALWLPRLEKLYVSGTSGDALRELVSKRREAGVPLATLYIESQCDVDDGDVEWLKENVKTFDFYEGSDVDEADLDGEEDEDDVADFYGDDDDDEDEWSDTS